MNSLSGAIFCPYCGEELTFHANISKITVEDGKVTVSLDAVDSYRKNEYEQIHQCKPAGIVGKKFAEELAK